ncbi:MAG: hypothetical protein H6540_06350 [Bacteroidales bacterium]|nr:hypothetical protein [Bacteroidales bacterium]
MKESIDTGRLIPENISKGFSREEVIQEAARCMHCDCRDIDTCRLEFIPTFIRADQKRYHSEEEDN